MVNLAAEKQSSFTDMALFWAMFFFVAFGLGYPTLNRYDPAKTPGTADTIEYRHSVLNDAPADNHVRYRVLIPYLARPIYHLSVGRISTWEPVWFALLLVNSAFVAGSAVLLIQLAGAFALPRSAAIIASMAYLLNFNVANDQLAGLVDAGDAFAIIALLLVFARRAWKLLPLILVIGVLAKETFLPISVLLAIGWFWNQPARPWKYLMFGALCGVAVLFLVPLLVSGHLVSPQQTVMEYKAVQLRSFVDPFLSWVVWLTFLWPLPFAIRGGRRLPRGLFAGSALAVVGIYFLGSFADMGASISRPLFSAAGPCLCLAFAAGVTEDPAGS